MGKWIYRAATSRTMPFQTIDIEYDHVTYCPLCSSRHTSSLGLLKREFYHFGQLRIPLPSRGVALCACAECSLLFKADVPTRESFRRVMAMTAAEVWREKPGEHTALPMLRPYLHGARSFLDIGASNGDLLGQLKGDRISALDIVEYEKCKDVITGEYIIGELDGSIEWSGDPYDVVTAFDVFEHFFSASRSVENVVRLVKDKLIVETGDWTTVRDPCRWYYTNLFEHQIFWSRKTFDYLEQFGVKVLAYTLVNHKGRRAMSLTKKLALFGIVAAQRVPLLSRLVLLCGRDPGHFGSPTQVDHAFVVMSKQGAHVGPR